MKVLQFAEGLRLWSEDSDETPVKLAHYFLPSRGSRQVDDVGTSSSDVDYRISRQSDLEPSCEPGSRKREVFSINRLTTEWAQIDEPAEARAQVEAEEFANLGSRFFQARCWRRSDARTRNTITVEQQFVRLAEQWYRETGMLSIIQKKAMHPAYQRIIGMGKDALPFILRELKRGRGHWFWALNAITGEEPVVSNSDFEAAIRAWLNWGNEHGYR